MEPLTVVWMDYVLVWHASVTLTDNEADDRGHAHAAIAAAYREEYGRDSAPFDAVRSMVKNHGVSIYTRVPA